MKIEEEFARNLNIVGVKAKDLIIAGVSGGADSLALLHLFHSLGYQVTAVYVDHGLREASIGDGDHVEEFCSRYHIPFQRKQIAVVSYAQETKKTIEEASRELRYACLFKTAASLRAGYVAVAHHADDQVETVLMHLLRGSGLSGLRGMQVLTRNHEWQTDAALLRPLLSLWKKDLLMYCEEQAIRPVQDESNFDTAFFRNRLRHELIPNLESYNAGVKRHLLTMSVLLQDDFAVLDEIVKEAIEKIALDKNANQVTFLREPFLPLSKAIKRMLLRQVISALRPALRDVDANAIERCITYLEGDHPTGQVDIVDHLVLFFDHPYAVILDENAPYERDDIPLLVTREKVKVAIGERCSINGSWFFTAQRMPIEDFTQKNVSVNPWSVVLDADQCGDILFLGTGKAGDRFIPEGLNGHSQKVSDIMTNQKIHRRIRERFPLIWDEKEIIWIPGYRVNARMVITGQTKTILFMQFIKK